MLQNEAHVLPGEPADMAIDPTTEQLFWTDWTSGAIMRSTFLGDDIVTIVSDGLTEPLGIAIGPAPLAQPAVPTVSQWGLAVMVCLLLATGTLVLRRTDLRSR